MVRQIYFALAGLALAGVVAVTPMAAYAHCAGKHTGDHEHCTVPAAGIDQEIVTVRDADKNVSQIVIMNADGTDVQVAFEQKNTVFRSVSWSGDGSKILFHGEVNRKSGLHWVQVFELNADGSRKRFAPGEPQFVVDADILQSRWSPKSVSGTGEWIAYSYNSNLWLVDPYSPDRQIQLTEDSDRGKRYPSWSPDADRIAFTSYPVEVPCSCPGDVEILTLTADSNNEPIELPGTRKSLILGTALESQFENIVISELDWANTSEFVVVDAVVISDPFIFQLWTIPTDPLQVAAGTKNITPIPDLAYSKPVWSPNDDALIYTRSGPLEECEIQNGIPDNSGAPLQGGPYAAVVAPLHPVDGIDDCASRYLGDGRSYEWWRGGAGYVPPAN